MKQAPKKYRINTYLDTLTIKEHKEAMKLIPELLQISINTFHNYRRIKIGDLQDIPYEKVRMMEILFEMQEGTLINYKIEGKNLKVVIKEDSSDFITDLQE